MNSKVKNKLLIDKIVKAIFLSITLLCSSVIVFVVLFILIKGISPFTKDYLIGDASYKANLIDFLTGTKWYLPPNVYGIGFIILNTFYVVVLATLIAVPVSVLTALFISKIAHPYVGKSLSYIVELLASIPSIIFGLFGMGIITKFVKVIADLFSYQSAGGLSTLSTVLVLSIMIIPTITLVSITSINAVKRDQINASLALGASETQTNFKIVLRCAKSGIFAGIILGVGRALGEATAVSMVCGNNGKGPTFNLFDTTRTLTSTMLLGLKETTGMDYDIRFSVGICLIIIIIITNLVLNAIKKRMS